MSYPITPSPSIHNETPTEAGTSQNQVAQQLQALFNEIPQIILNLVIGFIKQETGIDLTSLEPLILVPIQDAIALITNGLGGIDLTQGDAVLNAIAAAIQNLVATIVQQVIDTLINAGTGGGTSSGGSISSIGLALLDPIKDAEKLFTSVDTWAQEFLASLSGHSAQIATLQQSVAALNTATSTTAVSGFDTCDTTSDFVGVSGVSGTLVASNSSISSLTFAAAYHSPGPTSADKQGITLGLTNKKAGTIRAFICSNTTMTNYAAIELLAGGFSNDYVRFVIGSGPNVVIAQAQVTGRIGGNWVYDLKYDNVANTFYVFQNGTELITLRYVDTGNLVTHGSSQRNVGIATCCTIDASGFSVTDFNYYVNWS